MTPLNERDGWALHCCYWSATRTLFLDILPGPPASYPNADKFTFYGYKFEAVCTGAEVDSATLPSDVEPECHCVLRAAQASSTSTPRASFPAS
jgi:hypothetical protein